ncbi:MAG: sortase [Anaerolineales bacterium]|nr:sortase [Anaerolineales bacterium]
MKLSVVFKAFTALMIAMLVFGALPTSQARAATLCVGGGGCHATIQDAINAASAGDTINVNPGTYNEDITIGKSLTLSGADSATTIIVGQIGGPSAATVRIQASNVTVQEFTITRAGNNPVDWNNVSLNSAGIAIQGVAYTNALILNNIITGNRTGIDINLSSGHTITGNDISDNHTGMIFRNQTDNLTVMYNKIMNNRTVGVLFLDASGGSNIPVQSAIGSMFRGNNISGNWYGQAVDRQTGGALPLPNTTNTKDFQGNWWGVPTPVVAIQNSGEPLYSLLMPVAYGGSAVPPSPQPDILGLAAENILYLSSPCDYYSCPWTTPLLITTTGSVPADGDILNAGISQLTVTFNKGALDDGSAQAANNVVNYMLYEYGVNASSDTINCMSGIGGDDVNIAVNSATYDPITFTATINVNSGVPLPAGRYRLLVCGTTSIEDNDNNELNWGAIDSAVNFTVLATPTPTASPTPTGSLTPTASPTPSGSLTPGSPSLNAFALPATGFAVGRTTTLSSPSVAYNTLGDLWLEIPRLGVKMPIVGVPQAVNGNWDVSWLGNNAGWLQGTAFPTWSGNSAITGHVWGADNKAGPFLSINTLWYGDRISVHAWGQEYVYEVRSVSQVEPNATTSAFQHKDVPWLTLITCRSYDEASDAYRYRVLVQAVQVTIK